MEKTKLPRNQLSFNNWEPSNTASAVKKVLFFVDCVLVTLNVEFVIKATVCSQKLGGSNPANGP